METTVTVEEVAQSVLSSVKNLHYTIEEIKRGWDIIAAGINGRAEDGCIYLIHADTGEEIMTAGINMTVEDRNLVNEMRDGLIPPASLIDVLPRYAYLGKYL